MVISSKEVEKVCEKFLCPVIVLIRSGVSSASHVSSDQPVPFPCVGVAVEYYMLTVLRVVATLLAISAVCFAEFV